MTELIDRQEALEKMCGDCKSGYDGHCPHPFGMCHEYESILQVSTIEAEPVRHGRWEEIGGYEPENQGFACSVCDFATTVKSRFCPNCGARMGE